MARIAPSHPLGPRHRPHEEQPPPEPRSHVFSPKLEAPLVAVLGEAGAPCRFRWAGIRKATVTCTADGSCVTVDRASFRRLLGPTSLRMRMLFSLPLSQQAGKEPAAKQSRVAPVPRSTRRRGLWPPRASRPPTEARWRRF